MTIKKFFNSFWESRIPWWKRKKYRKVLDTTPSVSKGFSSDEPIRNHSQDVFDRWPFARQVADTIRFRQDTTGLVVGIYGVWGDGKSSVLNMLEQRLGKDNNCITIKFNPWYFNSEVALLQGLFGTLAAGIGNKFSSSDKLGKLLIGLGDLLSIASMSVGGVVRLDPGKAVKTFGSRLREKSLEEIRNRVQEILRFEKKKIVVLIDDIDRLDRAEIHTLFKTVKLSADFDYVTYILAFDDALVASALAEHYEGRGFLEKIIQVPLHLPPVDRERLSTEVFSRVEAALEAATIELSRDQATEFGRRFNQGLARGFRTPRQIQLYSNALLFALPLLKGEVHPVDQLLVEGIRVLYPSVYRLIRRNRHLLVRNEYSFMRDDGMKTEREGFLVTATEQMTTLEKKGVGYLLSELFPLLRPGGSGNDKRHFREQRICTDRYFSRFFRYAVPQHSTSDSAISAFLEELPQASEAEIDRNLVELVEKDNSLQVIERLRLHEQELNPSLAAKLIVALAKNSGLLSREALPFFYSAWEQASDLIYWLLRRIGHDDRREQARMILQKHAPLDFAAACFRLMKVQPEESEVKSLFSLEDEKSLGETLSTRIEQAAQREWLFVEFGKWAPFLMHIWISYGAQPSAKEYVENSLRQTPEKVGQYLVAFTNSVVGDRDRHAPFEREEYDRAIFYAEPTVIVAALKMAYRLGHPEGSIEFQGHPVPAKATESQVPSSEIRVAREFLRIHSRLTAENTTVPAEN